MSRPMRLGILVRTVLGLGNQQGLSMPQVETMPPSIVQFDNVRKHSQMGLVTVGALRGVTVAQIFNLLYRRIAFCGRREVLRPSGLSTPCRFQIGDTADCKSALRGSGYRDGQAPGEFPNAETRRPQRFAEKTFLRVTPRSQRLCVRRLLRGIYIPSVSVSVLVLLVGCTRRPLVTILNESSFELSDIVVSGNGFTNRFSRIAPDAKCKLTVHPAGESGLHVGFSASGKRIESDIDAYIEPNAGYRVTIIVATNLTLTWSYAPHYSLLK